jgi:hypothetical protein
MLSDFAVRLIFQQAVRNRTWAQNNVMNQPIDPLTRIMDENQGVTPAIGVFSGEASHKVRGQDITGFEDSKSTLTIAYYCPPAAHVTLDGREIAVEANGPIGAFVLDMLMYQSRMALIAPDNVWGRLWPMFVTSIETVEVSPPFLELGAGDARVLTRAMIFDYCPLRDPPFGRPMTASWQALHDAMMDDPGLRALAPLLKTVIETPAISADWQYAMMQLGLSDASALNTGIAPLEPTGDQLEEIGAYETDPEDDPNIIVPDTNEGAV